MVPVSTSEWVRNWGVEWRKVTVSLTRVPVRSPKSVST